METSGLFCIVHEMNWPHCSDSSGPLGVFCSKLENDYEYATPTAPTLYS